MKLIRLLLPIIPIIVPIAACDEGDIPEKEFTITSEGRTAHLIGSVSKTDEWPSGYSVAIAGFAEDEYALTSKTIDPSALQRDGEITLTGIPAAVSRLELCVIDRLRRRVATFASVSCDGTDADIMLEVGDIDAGMMQAMQLEIFNTTCINCHGANANAAASLSLLAGCSHASLVNIQSHTEPDETLVIAGDPDTSLLWKILSTPRSSSWRYDHSVEIVQATRLDLVKNWISTGAPE